MWWSVSKVLLILSITGSSTSIFIVKRLNYARQTRWDAYSPKSFTKLEEHGLKYGNLAICCGTDISGGIPFNHICVNHLKSEISDSNFHFLHEGFWQFPPLLVIAQLAEIYNLDS